jgi:hydrogenase/urease accessory protein HupE
MRSVLVCMALANMLVDPAFAHPTIGDTHSFVAGVIHPLTGIDHTSVMALVGLWGALVGGRAIWAWPLVFVAAMLIGFAAAAWGLQIALVEQAIVASIFVFGFLAAFRLRLPARLLDCSRFFMAMCTERRPQTAIWLPMQLVLLSQRRRFTRPALPWACVFDAWSRRSRASGRGG